MAQMISTWEHVLSLLFVFGLTHIIFSTKRAQKLYKDVDWGRFASQFEDDDDEDDEDDE